MNGVSVPCLLDLLVYCTVSEGYYRKLQFPWGTMRIHKFRDVCDTNPFLPTSYAYQFCVLQAHHSKVECNYSLPRPI